MLIPISRRGIDVRTVNAIGNMTDAALVGSHIETRESFATFARRTSHFVAFARETPFVSPDVILSSVGSTLSEHSVMFVYNKPSVSQYTECISDLSNHILTRKFAMFDLTLTAVEQSDGILACVTYDASKFAAEFIEVIVESYLRLLEAVAREGMAQDIRNLLTLSATEAERVEEFCDVLSQKEPFGGLLLQDLFESNVKKFPAAVAIDFSSGKQRILLTYEEVDIKARHRISLRPSSC